MLGIMLANETLYDPTDDIASSQTLGDRSALAEAVLADESACDVKQWYTPSGILKRL